jgi:cysteinyl-tRNA synthetase
MAGSVGNVVNIADLLQRHSPETVRFLLLSTHYRSPIEYSEEQLNEKAKSLQGFYRFFERYERITGERFEDLVPDDGRFLFETDEAGNSRLTVDQWNRVAAFSESRRAFLEFMDDDFNTGGANGALFSLLGNLNWYIGNYDLDQEVRPRSKDAVEDFKRGVAILKYFAVSILGLFWAPPQKAKLGGHVLIGETGRYEVTGGSAEMVVETAHEKMIAGLMQLLIDLRNNLRAEAKKIAAKDDPTKKALFEQTDVIRKRLGGLGVVLEDRPGGTTWRKA